MLTRLKRDVCEAHLRLSKNGLVMLGEGNVSAITNTGKYVVIKPSGVECGKLKSEDIVVVNLDGEKIEGKLNPSVDTWIHLEIYKAFPQVKSVIHTHSIYSTIFAQRKEPIPCLGTTHADAFYGDIPVARELTDKQIKGEYERNIGKAICEVLNIEIPAVLMPNHGPFIFGRAINDAVNNAIILEKVAKMAFHTGSAPPINRVLLDKHYLRKHGPERYYGQG